MPGIKVVAVLARCVETLLFCELIDTHALTFDDIEDCRAQLPSLIEQARREAQLGMVVLGQCRFRVGDKAPAPAGVTKPTRSRASAQPRSFHASSIQFATDAGLTLRSRQRGLVTDENLNTQEATMPTQQAHHVIAFTLAALVAPASPSPAAAEPGDWLAVTMARDGAWGAATSAWPTQAIAAAIRNCRSASSTTPSICGAQTATARTGWIVGTLCGDHTFLATAGTQVDAERALLRKVAHRRSQPMPGPPSCLPVFAISISPTDIGGEFQARAQIPSAIIQ